MARLMMIAAVALGLYTIVSNAPAQHARPYAEKKDQKSFAAHGIAQVKLNVWLGPIRIYADSPDRISVNAVRHTEADTQEKVDRWMRESRTVIEQHGATVTVEDIVPKDHDEYNTNHNQGDHGDKEFRTGLEVDVHVPPAMAVDITNLVGKVRVEGLADDVSVHSTVGNVTLAHMSSHGKSQSVKVRTQAGNVVVDGEVGDLAIKVGAGNVGLKDLACTGRSLDVTAGAGDAQIALRSLPAEKVNVTVATGQIDVRLPAQSRAHVVARSTMGKVHSDLPIGPAHRADEGFGDSLSGDLNGGGVRVDLNVSLGEIRVR